MTIFEMIDVLETEIITLRERTQELQRALETQSPKASKPANRKAKAKKKRAHKASPSRQSEPGDQASLQKGEQLALPALGETTEAAPEVRQVGKRLALGRSLVQLRRVASPRAL